MSPSSASTSDSAWRLLTDPPATGAWNMAVDEALLDGVAAGIAPPTLRFYQWAPPCLSLGYFQPFDVVDVAGCLRLGVDVVRRPTGGRAILHDRELTYSVALPRGLLGVDRPSAHEILLDGRKLVGSAQVRRATAILQHGSILIEPRIDRLFACLWLPDGPEARIEDGVAGLAEVGNFDPTRIAGALADAFAEEFGVRLVPGRLRPDERQAADDLVDSKYRAPAWTERPPPMLATNTTRTR